MDWKVKKSKMKKRISALTILIAASVLSAGCGKINGNINVKSHVAESSQSEKNTETTAVTTAGKTKKATSKVSDSVLYAGGEPEESELSVSDSSSDNNGLKNNNSEPDVKQENKPKEETRGQTYQTQSPPSYNQAETEPTYIQGILIVNKTYPLPASYAPGRLTTETQNAFDKMAADAAAEGLSLYDASDYRSYELQESLYNRYVARDGKEAADTYSARPGHSEHQTGLSLDLNSIEDSFAYTDEGIWVAENCYKYGFIIRYPEGKDDITGYKYEPWHIRYLGTELAEKVYNSGLCLEEYLGITSKYSY